MWFLIHVSIYLFSIRFLMNNDYVNHNFLFLCNSIFFYFGKKIPNLNFLASNSIKSHELASQSGTLSRLNLCVVTDKKNFSGHSSWFCEWHNIKLLAVAFTYWECYHHLKAVHSLTFPSMVIKTKLFISNNFFFALMM